MIISAACRAIINDNETVIIKCHRHCDFFETMKLLHVDFDKNSVEQGFIEWDSHTGVEQFVLRPEAARIALRCNQIKNMDDFNPNCLYSEDCW